MQQFNLSADPQISELGGERQSLEARTQNLVIRDAVSYTSAADWLKSIKGFLKTIEDARVRITKPMNDALKEVNQQAKDAAAPFLSGEAKIKAAMLAYAKEQERLRQEEQRKANEAAEKERRRLQEIADRAAAKGQEAKSEAFAERASAVVAPVAHTARPAVSGISMRTVTKYEIVDPRQINAAYMSPDMEKIGKVVKSMGLGAAELVGPGVRIWTEKQIASAAAI